MEGHSISNRYKGWTIFLTIVLISVMTIWFFQNKNANEETDRQYSSFRSHLFSTIIHTDHSLDILLEGNLDEDEEQRELIRLAQHLRLLENLTSRVPNYLDEVMPAIGPSDPPFLHSINFITDGVDDETVQFRPIQYSTPLNDTELDYLNEVKEYITYLREEMASADNYWEEDRNFTPEQFNQLMNSMRTYTEQYRSVFSVEVECEQTGEVHNEVMATVQEECTMIDPFTRTVPPRELVVGETVKVPLEEGDGQAYFVMEEAFFDAAIIVRNLDPNELHKIEIHQEGTSIASFGSEENVHVRFGESDGETQFRPAGDGTLYVSMIIPTSLVEHPGEIQIKVWKDGEKNETAVTEPVHLRVN